MLLAAASRPGRGLAGPGEGWPLCFPALLLEWGGGWGGGRCGPSWGVGGDGDEEEESLSPRDSVLIPRGSFRPRLWAQRSESARLGLAVTSVWERSLRLSVRDRPGSRSYRKRPGWSPVGGRPQQASGSLGPPSGGAGQLARCAACRLPGHLSLCSHLWVLWAGFLGEGARLRGL